MPLYLHNSLTREREIFVPQDSRRVTLWCCGPTVYDTPHIGNARPAVVFDVLFRLLRAIYGAEHVVYARNITDIDDKIMARAAANGEPIRALTERTTAYYREVCDKLKVLPPSYEPRATSNVDIMISMIETLVGVGFAYEAAGHVLFELAKFPAHGALSRHEQDDLTVHRVEPASYKRAPGDFVLWKPSTAEQPGWESPWGRGRPGWHIECSAMIYRLLGQTIDMHGGGADLRFPHHECELTQSHAAHGRPLAKYWLHNGMVTIDGAKMAKSDGNIVAVETLLQTYPGEVIRLALLETHYRSPFSFRSDLLDAARRTLSGWYRTMQPYQEVAPIPTDQSIIGNKIIEALSDDLNTPAALNELHRLLSALKTLSEIDAKEAGRLAGAIKGAAGLLGLLQDDPDRYLRRGLDLDEEADDLFHQMIVARAVKDFATSDALRAQLRSKGIIVENSDKGTIWRRE